MNIKIFQLILSILILVLSGSISKVYADTLNPCEYMNINANTMNNLDTGADDNFERIKQQNNKQMVIACQEYEIKLLNEAKSDLNRDNY